MIKSERISSVAIVLIMMVSFPSLMAQEKKLSKEEDDTRIDKYEKQLQDYLVNYIVEGYDDRAAKLWNRDYSSGYALERSVEPNRRRWEQVIKPPVLEKTGSLKKSPYEVNEVHAEWVTLQLGDITAEGILAFPKGASKEDPVPIIIAQHGIGSGPETPFENGKSYKGYAKALLDAGFAVLAPLNLRSVERRNNIERYARLANISIPGIEF